MHTENTEWENIANTEYCHQAQSTEIVANRKTQTSKIRKEVSPSAHGKAWRSLPRGEEGGVKRGPWMNEEQGSRVVDHAAKLLNGQQPNLAACNRWLGPQTQIRVRSTTPIVAEGLSDLIITTPQFILTHTHRSETPWPYHHSVEKKPGYKGPRYNPYTLCSTVLNTLLAQPIRGKEIRKGTI
ncbi:hypothetical protein C8F04DRAFT_1187732 [Mycena alexandri]|uniref:Uncharacterized protein n=1 Tax=Mycena alexandri TaxID=1745969 RepID=A0AAD6SMH3_9AGAR|nr:hypothetical protein C8F04DRAFT_1187732 [Mycena alexandri]